MNNILLNGIKKNNILKNNLTLTIDASERAHKDRVLISYTEHGIEHSKRIISLLENLFYSTIFKKGKMNSLNEYEIFILLSAIYLHDIGIQINDKFHLNRFSKEYNIEFNDSVNKSEYIRKNHHFLSKYWIECNLKKDKYISNVYYGDIELGKIVAMTVASHGLNFMEDNKYNLAISYMGQKIRLRLLCILLSLGDSLDCDCRRIDYEKLKYTEVEVTSKIHWLKHYYVNSVLIENNLIKIFYCFPEIEGFEQEAYKTYFTHFNTYWIKINKNLYQTYLSELNIVYEIQEFFTYSMTKDKLTSDEYSCLEDELVDIVEMYYKNSLEVPISNFKISIGVLIKDKNVLMVKRRQKENNLLWQFPAGIVKPNEDIEKRLIKEVKDETGITSVISSFLGKRIHPDTRTICYYYALEYVTGEISNGDDDENEEVSWIPIKNYSNIITSNLYPKIKRYLVCQEEK